MVAPVIAPDGRAAPYPVIFHVERGGLRCGLDAMEEWLDHGFGVFAGGWCSVNRLSPRPCQINGLEPTFVVENEHGLFANPSAGDQ